MAHGPALGRHHGHTEVDITDLDHNDPDAIHDNVSGEINALSEKTTVVDADLLIIEDSEASGVKKKIQMSKMSGTGAVVDTYTETSATSFSTTKTNLYTVDINVAAGDILVIDALVGVVCDPSAGSDDYGIWVDFGNVLNLGTNTNLSGSGTENPYYLHAGISVFSSSAAHLWNILRAYSPASITEDNWESLTGVSTGAWDEIGSDLTGSLTVDLDAISGSTPGTGTIEARVLSWVVRKFTAT